ncbi:MAG: AMP-binding protein [Xanthomonadaceae bacterium]|nr:AMP-binding protein [Xanthomonadaceae bacterium]
MFDALPSSSLRVLSADGEYDARSLADAVARCADALTQAGLRRVASRLDNGAPWLILDLALRRIEGAHIPLPTFFTPAQTEHALRASGAEAVVAAETMALPGAISLTSGLRATRLEPATVALPTGTACITYTSGTTAQAKGVCLNASSMLRVATSLTEATASLRPRRHLCLMPLSTLLENIAGVYAAWLTDAEIAVPSLTEIGYSGAAGLDIAALLRCLHRYRPESVIVFPQLLLALTMAAEQGHALPLSLRFVAVGGGRVGEGLLARAAAVGLPVYEGYGLTECASVVCLNRPEALRPGSVGRPLSHARVFVRDEALWVDGVRCLGYLDGDDLPPGPIATGDLGRIDDDGFVHVTGRRKHMFITAYGRNVSPEWVETEVLQHPLFAQAIVLGEARPHNVAVLSLRRADTDDAAIRRALVEINRGLPDYAQVSDYVRADAPFAVENGLLTPNGRVRRDAIAQQYADAIAARYADEAAPFAIARVADHDARHDASNDTPHETRYETTA